MSPASTWQWMAEPRRCKAHTGDHDSRLMCAQRRDHQPLLDRRDARVPAHCDGLHDQ